MKNLIKLLFLFFQLFMFSCYGQKNVINFNPRYLPDKIYKKNITQMCEIQLEIQGNKEMLEEIIKNGIENPAIQTEKEREKILITTGKLSPNHTFPISGKTENIENSKLKGIAFKGYCKLGDSPIINSLDSLQLKKDIEQKLILYIEKLLRENIISQRKIKIGDSISVVSPLINYSTENLNIDLKETTIYYLQKIKGKKVFFNFTQNYITKAAINKSQFSGNGKGNGILVYDLEKQFIIYSKSSGKVELDSGNIYPDINFSIKMKFNTKEKNTIK